MFKQVDYLLAAPGARPERFHADPSLLPADPAAFLTRALGRLAWCRVDGAPVPLPAVPVASVPEVQAEVTGAAEVLAEPVPAVVPVAPVELAPVAPSPPARDAIGRMIEAGGPALMSPTDAARAYPTVFGGPDAAKKALQRAAPPPAHLIEISYTLAALGARPRRALAAPEHVPELRPWLEAQLGPVAHLDAPPTAATP